MAHLAQGLALVGSPSFRDGPPGILGSMP